MNSEIEKIRQLISDGFFEEAINELKAIAPRLSDKALQNEILVISSQQRRLDLERRGNLTDADQISRRQNRLTHQILQFVADLETNQGTTPPKGNTYPGGTGKTNKPAQNSSKNKYLVPILLALVVLLGGAFAISQFGFGERPSKANERNTTDVVKEPSVPPAKNPSTKPPVPSGGSGESRPTTPPAKRKADLKITAFQMSPNPPVQGKPLRMQAVIKNEGETDAGPFDMKWYGGANFSTPGVTQQYSGLGAGQQQTINFQYAGYTSWYGKITSRLEIDTKGQVDEINENNNKLEKTHAVSKSAAPSAPTGGQSNTGRGPDLVITAFQMKPTKPKKGERIYMQAIIKNKGSSGSGPFKVEWFGGENYSKPAYSKRFSGVAAGGQEVISLQYDGYPSWYGSITSRLVVDADNQVKEANESNNIWKETYPVGR